MKDIILIGGGGHCKAAIDVIEAEGQYSIAGIVERPDVTSKPVLGYPILGGDDDLSDLLTRYPTALIAIGQIKSPMPRQSAFETAKVAGAVFPCIISPLAYVSKYAHTDAGTLVMHGAVVNAAAAIGSNVILNSQSLVEHDAQIGNHCHISTGARINGDAVVEDGCFIGSGAIVTNGVTIGKGSIVGAGVVIRHNISDDTLVSSTSEKRLK